MALSREEKETIIRFDESSSMAEVFTYSSGLKKRMTDFCNRFPEEFSIKRGDNGDGSLTFNCPKRRISVTAPRTLTPEQRAQARKNLKR